jgi:hypothetical protein
VIIVNEPIDTSRTDRPDACPYPALTAAAITHPITSATLRRTTVEPFAASRAILVPIPVPTTAFPIAHTAANPIYDAYAVAGYKLVMTLSRPSEVTIDVA